MKMKSKLKSKEKDNDVADDTLKENGLTFICNHSQLKFNIFPDRKIRCGCCQNAFKNIPHHLKKK